MHIHIKYYYINRRIDINIYINDIYIKYIIIIRTRININIYIKDILLYK